MARNETRQKVRAIGRIGIGVALALALVPAAQALPPADADDLSNEGSQTVVIDYAAGRPAVGLAGLVRGVLQRGRIVAIMLGIRAELDQGSTPVHVVIERPEREITIMGGNQLQEAQLYGRTSLFERWTLQRLQPRPVHAELTP
jgi:hypothetical protein